MQWPTSEGRRRVDFDVVRVAQSPSRRHTTEMQKMSLFEKFTLKAMRKQMSQQKR